MAFAPIILGKPIEEAGNGNPSDNHRQAAEPPKKTFAAELNAGSEDDREEEDLQRLYAKKHKPLTKISDTKIAEFEQQQQAERLTREELEKALLK